ncbi:MAG: putative N-acetyltransferase YycN [Candidatus Anoxychlamydiales bacterium]|nr:putative N-acetyltransferase YycN [Candidatus Anoxychlamydiales bacterium]
MISLISISEMAKNKFYEDFVPFYAHMMVENETFDNYDKAYKNSKEQMDKFFFDEKLSDQQHLYDIYTDDTKIGFIWFSQKAMHDPNIAWLCWLTIDEEYRNKGYAKETILKVENELKQLGIKKVGLNVYKKNEQAFKLYKKLGYEIKLMRKNHSNKIVNYIMEKNI